MIFLMAILKFICQGSVLKIRIPSSAACDGDQTVGYTPHKGAQSRPRSGSDIPIKTNPKKMRRSQFIPRGRTSGVIIPKRVGTRFFRKGEETRSGLKSIRPDGLFLVTTAETRAAFTTCRELTCRKGLPSTGHSQTPIPLAISQPWTITTFPGSRTNSLFTREAAVR